MADDDLLRELLTSPLERPSRRRRPRARAQEPEDRGETTITPEGTGEAGTARGEVPRVPMLWGAGAAVLAAIIVVAGYSVAAGDPAPTTTTTTTTTPAVVDDGSPSGLPPGYVAAGDRLGMRVERILARARRDAHILNHKDYQHLRVRRGSRAVASTAPSSP